MPEPTTILGLWETEKAIIITIASLFGGLIVLWYRVIRPGIKDREKERIQQEKNTVEIGHIKDAVSSIKTQTREDHKEISIAMDKGFSQLVKKVEGIGDKVNSIELDLAKMKGKVDNMRGTCSQREEVSDQKARIAYLEAKLKNGGKND